MPRPLTPNFGNSYEVTYRYQFEKYRYGCKTTCPSCQRRKAFKKYVDVTTGEYVGDDIGMCDRKKKCGYHKSPKELKTSHVPVSKVAVKYREPDVYNHIPTEYVLKSLSRGKDNFSKALIARFPSKNVAEVLGMYYIGISQKWENSTIFWQIDQDFVVRTGKIMQYNGLSRVKEPYSRVCWSHTPDKGFPDFYLKQCLFGQHLVGSQPIGIVESEKTAIICRIFRPRITWLATGGLQNISPHRFEFLDGREDVTFYPDKGCEGEWKQKVKKINPKWVISEALVNNEQVEEGEDPADLILKMK